MIGTARTHHSTASNPTPCSEIYVMSSDKVKGDKQLGSKKNGKSNKKQTSTPQEQSSDQQTGNNRKPRYPFIICSEEHFVRDFPHHA